ncbi:SMI1/KNR4 family protein [Paenibacillus sp. IHBB 10380]|uniref:SMI1/KNR4 family protein n=1 Tax=Paenibacillus sp. IHBB 10380 TaxID=1566358 RepID=UPI0005CFCDC4|nr:SMI1/KNR4 family protein [Paenibacillus sp. IHBB 10380]AJS61119.1 SMI1 / KNR4 [Paenibacillus sp. IHBB 10380]
MSNLPLKLEGILEEDTYKRQNKTEVHEALIRLDVVVSDTFREFYNKYMGPFWEEVVPFELLDIVEEKNNIESYTFISRREHGWPKQYLVLSEMSTNAVLVLDTVTDKVYKVNFEVGDDLLIQGQLKESWLTFQDFLKDYFNC